ncbi:MAG: putative GIY-YIG superfamily endonuclease [Planctomycetota bacterium]|jgi:predicted GIY-YIG superfamily endonuclease
MTEQASELWVVYVLVSTALGRTYVGIALDIERRLLQHNGELPGGARSTRGGRPWELAVTYGPYATRGQASKVEYALKQRKGIARLEWDGSSGE